MKTTVEDIWKIASAMGGRLINKITISDIEDLEWEQDVDLDDLDNRPGVYMLINKRKEKLEYVGVSINVRRRIKNNHHIYNQELHSIHFIEIECEKYRLALERVIINNWHPPENKKVGNTGGSDGLYSRNRMRMPA